MLISEIFMSLLKATFIETLYFDFSNDMKVYKSILPKKNYFTTMSSFPVAKTVIY